MDSIYSEPLTFEYDDYTENDSYEELRWKITYKSGKELVISTYGPDQDFIRYILSKGARYVENVTNPDDRLENIWPSLAEIIKEHEEKVS